MKTFQQFVLGFDELYINKGIERHDETKNSVKP